MPFVDERLHADMALMGEDFWTYGIEKNRHVLEHFFTQHHRQGLSSRLVTLEDMFHPATFEQFTI
jgi:4,5-dihydroxyphthalate decarboxylase